MITKSDLYFITRQLGCLNDLYNIWYKNGIKILPNMFSHGLKSLDLSKWLTDEGSFRGSGLTIYTNSFTLS